MIAKLTSQTHRDNEIKLQVEVDSAGPDELFSGKEVTGKVVLSRGDGGKIVATITIAEAVNEQVKIEKVTEVLVPTDEAQRADEAAS